MGKLFYATFEKGFAEFVPEHLKRLDKNFKIKKLYDDSVLFFAGENFRFDCSIFLKHYIVFDDLKKEGMGAVNGAMKHLLSRDDLKIRLPAKTQKIRFLILKPDSKMPVDQKLKSAVETMLAKRTKCQVGYFGADTEIALIVKPDGECILAREVVGESRLAGFVERCGYFPTAALVMSELSEPAAGEVCLDPFAGDGAVAYARTVCFGKANVIASEADKVRFEQVKKLAKSLKSNAFSVMSHDFLSPEFPIHFVSKIVTRLPSEKMLVEKFFEKLETIDVKKIVVQTAASDLGKYLGGKFVVEKTFSFSRENIFVIKKK